MPGEGVAGSKSHHVQSFCGTDQISGGLRASPQRPGGAAACQLPTGVPGGCACCISCARSTCRAAVPLLWKQSMGLATLRERGGHSPRSVPFQDCQGYHLELLETAMIARGDGPGSRLLAILATAALVSPAVLAAEVLAVAPVEGKRWLGRSLPFSKRLLLS